MKISVCIDALFWGKDFIKSMKEVKSCGIDSFEFWTWWDKDIDSIAAAREELDMNVTALCTRFISLVDDSCRAEYLASLLETISVAEKLNCRRIITQVGNYMPDISKEKQHKNLVDGLTACVPLLEKAGITLVFEPLNTTIDHKGYFLWSSDEAFEICDEVGSPYVKVLFDLYHQQIMEGNIILKSTGNIDKIGHFHAAGNPGRHELTKGEINYHDVFDALDASGYDGYVGFEYFPLNDVCDGLKYWAAKGE